MAATFRRFWRWTVASALLLSSSAALGAPTVWVIDDGEKIGRDETSLPFKTGQDNPIWSPGQSIRLFALQNETVAFQVIVEADGSAQSGVTVDLASLSGPGGVKIENQAGATDPTKFSGRWIERFVEHYFEIKRHSGTGYDPTLSLGWDPGSGPNRDRYTGWVPDALIPVEVAKSWAPYPLAIQPRQNGAIWIDITVPKTQTPGTYSGQVVVKAGSTALATIPVELSIHNVVLADVPAKTMVYYGQFMEQKFGAADMPAANRHLWQLFHRHRISPMHVAYEAGDVQNALGALTGTLYSKAESYEGSGEGVGDGILSIGPYGALGDPGDDQARITQIAGALEKNSLFNTTDVFVYAIDETCQAGVTSAWKQAITSWGAQNASVKKISVGVTCSANPGSESADIVMVASDSFSSSLSSPGKKFWIYNGRQPYTGAFMTDMDAVSMRVNGWIAGMYEVGRWFYWQSTFWRDGNPGGWGNYDPYVTAETFHNPYSEWAVGDGVLLYPGKQVDGYGSSLGMAGVVASIRLKNWRRGIEDAGYIKLARSASAAKTEAIYRGLLPNVLQFAASVSGRPPTWSTTGARFFDARKQLLALFSSSPPNPPPVQPPVNPPTPPDPGTPVPTQPPADSGNPATPGTPNPGTTIPDQGMQGHIDVGCGHALSARDEPMNPSSAIFLALVLFLGILHSLRARRRETLAEIRQEQPGKSIPRSTER